MTLPDKSAEILFLPNNNIKLSPEIEVIFEKPLRQPCTYCNRVHIDVPCNEQINSIKKMYKID